MRRSTGWLVLAVVALAAVALAVASGVIRPLTSPDTARPPCDQLPRRTEVVRALGDHGELVAQLEATGDAVHVTDDAPCADQPDKALVVVTYRTAGEREAIDHILTTQDGFGVPVQLVRR